jgi:hypothetical protein
MKTLTLVGAFLGSLVLFFVTAPVFAHDGDLGTITFDDMDMQSALHDETIDNPEEIYKGWLFVGLQNNTPVAWTDFHFQLTTSDPLKPVIFVTDPPYLPTTSLTPGDYTYWLSDNDTQLNFLFTDDPVLPTGIVTFGLYTDNTAYNNPSYTICMTPTPEPTTIALLGLGGLALFRKRR